MGLKLQRRVVACGSAVIMLSALACGGGDEAPETSPSSEMPTAAGSPPAPLEKGTRELTLPGPGGTPVTGYVASGELPENYPSDIPPPPGAEPRASLGLPGKTGLTSFLSPSPRADVLAHFQKTLPAEGWTVETDETDKRAQIKAAKGDRKATVNITEGASGTEIVVSFQGS